MNEFSREFLISKLKVFISETDAIKSIDETISSISLKVKDSYNREEFTKILNALNELGGYYKFVASSAKIKLMRSNISNIKWG